MPETPWKTENPGPKVLPYVPPSFLGGPLLNGVGSPKLAPGFLDFPRSPNFLTSKSLPIKDRVLWESFYSPLLFLLFFTRLLLFPATPTSCHTTNTIPHNFPQSFRSSSHSRFDSQPQSFYSFVWGTFCLFFDDGERFECGRFGSWLGCVVSWRQLLRVAFQSRIELEFRSTLQSSQRSFSTVYIIQKFTMNNPKSPNLQHSK